MGDAPLWQTIPLYALGLAALTGLVFLVVLLAVRVALRPHLEHSRLSARRQEDLLRDIAGSAEYVADIADAWAEAEARRQGSAAATPER